MLNKLFAAIEYRARMYGHVRFEEPVLVFESDDWGKVAGREDGIYPVDYGTRTDWSHDRLENEDELEDLYTVLESFRSDFERPPVLTSNIVVSNPDFEKTIADNYRELHLLTVDKHVPYVYQKWLEGLSRGVFYPQYHGRLHYNLEKYLAALQTDEKTKFLFNQGINGGMENFEESEYAFYSEYFRADSSSAISGLADWIRLGLKEFERMFGYKSASTIAPNYVLHPNDFNTLAELGIGFLQGGNKITYTTKGGVRFKNYCQGFQHPSGLTILARNHKFEPNRGKKEWQADFSIKAAKHWLQRGVPSVIDTHRFNYVSTFAKKSCEQLRLFLQAMRGVKDLKILTTPELGEAVVNNGSYTDVFSGELKQLTPAENGMHKIIRQTIS